MAKLSSLLTSCRDLQSRLITSRDSVAIQTLVSTLEDHIATAQDLCRKKPRSADRPTCHDLDQEATALWNLATKLRREGDSGVEGREKLLLQTRTFAFLVIDIARRSCRTSGPVPSEDLLHILKLALKAAKSCLGGDEIDLAMLALEKAAKYIQDMHDQVPPPDYADEFGQLEAEYFILRTALCWKESRLDVAEHMFRKAGSLLQGLDAHAAENLAEILFEIGRDFAKKDDFQIAVRWLERGYEVIDAQDLERLSRDGAELRLSILQALVHALVGTRDADNVRMAQERVAYVESEIGAKPIILLLRLELLECVPKEEFDTQMYADILRRMITSFSFSDAHFKFLLHHIRRLHDLNGALAANVLDELLTTKVFSSETASWVERGVVLRIWMTASQSTIIEDFLELGALFSKAMEAVGGSLSPSASAAAQSLIWKRIESVSADGQFDTAESWCQLARHDLFESSGLNNMAKVERKRIICAMSQNNYEKAKAVFLEMKEPIRAEVLTQYLMFKVAVRSGDEDLGEICLRTLSSPATKTLDFLYACILDAQQVGDRQFVTAAMKSLVERYDFAQTDMVNLPALLRCTLRLLCPMLSSSTAANPTDKAAIDESSVVEDICHMFESAVEAMKKSISDEKGLKIFTVKELDWFSQNSYNLGLQHCETWNTSLTLRMINACLAILGHYPDDIPFEHGKDLALKGMCCNFVAAAAHVSIARAHDVKEEQLQGYLVMRRHVAEFGDEFQKQCGNLDENILADLQMKLATLLVFDFEGAVALRDWDDLRGITERAKGCGDATAYKAMADCLLRASDVPSQALFATMRAIINELWGLDNMDLERVAKYIRCLFQMILPLECGMAFQLAGEALQLAREAASAEPKLDFPGEELEWLVTVSWNHAIDLYAVEKDDKCKKWALKAINLAHYCPDEGRLEGDLQKKFSALKWDGA